MNGEIDKLIKFITDRYKFDGSVFPELTGEVNDEQRLKFAIKHTALHFAKTAGKIVGACEDADHGKEIDIVDLKTNVIKSLINSFRLAELLGMKEADIIRDIEEKYSK